MSEHDPAGIGAALQHARESRGLTVTEAARASGVPASTVDTLERGEPGQLAGQPPLLAHLRVYARSLGLDPEGLLVGLTAAGPANSAGMHARGRRRRAAPMVGAAVAAVALLGLVAVVTAAMLTGDEDELGLVDPVATTPTPTPTPTATPTPTPTPASTPTLDRDDADGGGDELPGRPPDETRVQLLDGVRGDGEAVEQAEAVLDELGYEVVATGSMAESWDTSGVYYTDGWREEAESLREREGRVTDVAPHPGFTADADLHVVVGQDWPEPTDRPS